MKKTLITCLAIVALFAVASSASAIVCTIDQRPAATLLVPFFQIAVNADGSLKSGADALDTLVTITNASSAPMLAHVNVYNERSVLVLDFNIALTGFDVQSMSMGQVLSGHLPQTPVGTSHLKPDVTVLANDACQRNPAAPVYPNPAGYLRIRPVLSADPVNDPVLATTIYPDPAFPPGGAFAAAIMGGLTATDTVACNPSTATFPLANPGVARGYIVIDHANYCNVSDPTLIGYYSANALGNEDNLFGEVIFLSGTGLPTFGASTVNIESSRVFSLPANGGFFDQSTGGGTRERTFYARYWSPTTIGTPTANANTALFATNPWNNSYGDEREPLGLRFATRYFEGNGVISFLRVWRASAGNLTALTGGTCTATEPTVAINFFDEDENPVSSIPTGPCPSPFIGCVPPSNPLNFGLETQRTRANTFVLPPAFAGEQVGWLSTSFVNLGVTGNNGGLLDQAWMEYEFQGGGAFINAAVPGTQLDPTTCHPLLIPLTNAGFTIVAPDTLTNPVTPGGQSGTGTNPPIGTGK